MDARRGVADSKVARDFRRIEAEHRFLSCPDTRGRIQDIIGGILCDIKQTGRPALFSPPRLAPSRPSHSPAPPPGPLPLQLYRMHVVPKT